MMWHTNQHTNDAVWRIFKAQQEPPFRVAVEEANVKLELQWRSRL